MYETISLSSAFSKYSVCRQYPPGHKFPTEDQLVNTVTRDRPNVKIILGELIISS